MNESPTLTRAQIEAFRVEWFAKAYLSSPWVQTMFDRGEPLSFFVPLTGVEDSDWDGVDITIAGVSKGHAHVDEMSHAIRGNGYSEQHGRPLRPGDFGVHSHPDTGTLLSRKDAADH